MTRAAPTAFAIGIGLGLGLVASACSTIGSEGFERPDSPHAGTGPFRLLDAQETGLEGSPDGRALPRQGDMAIESPMVAGHRMFFATARLAEEDGMDAADLAPWEIDHSRFGPRRIFRATHVGDPQVGYEAPTRVLEADASWEGDEVFDPWMVQLEDGSARLYYAAEGGIGVAEADSITGELRRVGDGPVLGAIDGVVPRRPSVVPGEEDGWLMYYQRGFGIELAESSDGLSFERVGPVSFTLERQPEPDDRAPEIFKRAPSAVRVRTPTGRSVVRLYFQSVRQDVTATIDMAASLDGRRFERSGEPAFTGEAPASPAPLVLDSRVTLLYLTETFEPSTPGDTQLRAVVGAVAPAAERIVPEPMPDESETP